jgi:hypothetical protein
MSILFSGDFHANADNELCSISRRALLRKYRHNIYNGIKCHIILGDSGFSRLIPDKAGRHNHAALGARPFPVLCVQGEYDPMGILMDVREDDIGIGETVYPMWSKPLIAQPKCGKVYSIEGFKILVLGGFPGKYWDMNGKKHSELLELLDAGNTFDLVVSPTGPHCINKKLFGEEQPEHFRKYEYDGILMDDIHDGIQFREWWCGYWHKDLYYFDEETGRGYQYLYRSTKVVDMLDNRMVVYDKFGGEER